MQERSGLGFPARSNRQNRGSEITYRSRLESPAKALGPMEEILLWLM